MSSEPVRMEYSNVSEYKHRILSDVVKMVHFTGNLTELEQELTKYESQFPNSPIKMLVNSTRDSIEIDMPRKLVYFDL